MAGKKLEQAKKALQFCVENLNDEDRFEIIRFSTEVEPLFDKLVRVNESNRAKANDFIKELKPIGGTAIDDALKQALALRDTPRRDELHESQLPKTIQRSGTRITRPSAITTAPLSSSSSPTASPRSAQRMRARSWRA